MGLFLSFLLVFSVLTASAQHGAKGNAKAPDGTDEEVTVGASGQQAAVDAKTGKLRQPTTEEIQQLTAPLAANHSVEGLTPIVLGNGTIAVDLQGRFENASLVKLNPDGTLSMTCVTTAKQAEDFLKSVPKQTKPDGKNVKPNSDPSTWEVK